MTPLLDIPNALAQGYTNWGQTAGQNIAQGIQRRREMEQQNALAAALPGALSGDPTALATIARSNPTAAISLYGNQQEQKRADAKTATEQMELKRGRFYDTLAGTIASTAVLPPEQQEAGWQAAHARLKAQFPEFDDGQGDDDWATAKAHAPALAMMKKEYGDTYARLGLIPQEPAKPEGLPEKARLYEYAKKQGFGGSFEDFLKVGGGGDSGASPYFQFLPGADGYLVGNARTGTLAPGMVNGQRAMPGALDPSLQGQLAGAKARGTEVGQAEGAQDKKAIAAPNIEFLLNQAKTLLPQSTGSGAGALYDKGAAFFGGSTAGAEAGDQLKVIAGNLTLAQPRMEGPQSDADRLLYQQMAADLGNTSLPVSRRTAALSQLERLNKKWKSRPATTPTAPPAGGVVDWNDLP